MHCAKRSQCGLTLIEMMVVVALVSLIAGISFPAVTSGLDTLRLRSAAESIVALFNTALDRADRTQQPVEIRIDRAANAVGVIGVSTGLEKIVEMPQGVRITAIAPVLPMGEGPVRSFVIMPQGAVPRFSITLVNARGAARAVMVDPVSGIARMEAVR